MFSLSRRFLLVLVCSLFYFNPAWAQNSVKIGVVNVGLILEQAPQANAASRKLEQEFSPQQEELMRLGERLDKEQDELRRNRLAMSEAQLNAKERELAMLNREIQRRQNDIQELLNIRRNEELANLQSLVNVAIREVGTSHSYDLILYEGIAYTHSRIDITQDVLDFLSNEFQKQDSNFNR